MGYVSTRDMCIGASSHVWTATPHPLFPPLPHFTDEQRAKMIKNAAVINEQVAGNVDSLQKEIRRLNQELLRTQARLSAGSYNGTYAASERSMNSSEGGLETSAVESVVRPEVMLHHAPLPRCHFSPCFPAKHGTRVHSLWSSPAFCLSCTVTARGNSVHDATLTPYPARSSRTGSECWC